MIQPFTCGTPPAAVGGDSARASHDMDRDPATQRGHNPAKPLSGSSPPHCGHMEFWQEELIPVLVTGIMAVVSVAESGDHGAAPDRWQYSQGNTPCTGNSVGQATGGGGSFSLM